MLKFNIEFRSTDNEVITKTIPRLILLFGEDNQEVFENRRRLAFELREIFYSLIKYMQSISNFIEEEEIGSMKNAILKTDSRTVNSKAMERIAKNDIV